MELAFQFVILFSHERTSESSVPGFDRNRSEQVQAGFSQTFWDICFLLLPPASCLPTLPLRRFYTPLLSLPVCDWPSRQPTNWLNRLRPVNGAACLFYHLLGCSQSVSVVTCSSFVFTPPECHACYHRSCFRAGKDCPRCQRLAERRKRMARKNMEEQEDEGGGT